MYKEASPAALNCSGLNHSGLSALASASSSPGPSEGRSRDLLGRLLSSLGCSRVLRRCLFLCGFLCRRLFLCGFLRWLSSRFSLPASLRGPSSWRPPWRTCQVPVRVWRQAARQPDPGVMASTVSVDFNEALCSPSVTYMPYRPLLTRTGRPEAGSSPSSRSGPALPAPLRFGWAKRATACSRVVVNICSFSLEAPAVRALLQVGGRIAHSVL